MSGVLEFHATPHYCLRQLGLIESNASKGGNELRRQRVADREHLANAAGAGGAESEEQAFRAYLEGEAREAFQQVAQRLMQDLIELCKSREDAEESGRYMARLHFLNRFRREHPERHRDGFERLDALQLRNRFGNGAA